MKEDPQQVPIEYLPIIWSGKDSNTLTIMLTFISLIFEFMTSNEVGLRKEKEKDEWGDI